MRQISPCQIQGGEGQGWGQHRIRGASQRNEYLTLLLWQLSLSHTLCVYIPGTCGVSMHPCVHAVSVFGINAENKHYRLTAKAPDGSP